MDELDNSLIKGFEEAMNLRQEADYDMNFSEEGAKETVESARNLLKRTRTILDKEIQDAQQGKPSRIRASHPSQGSLEPTKSS